MGETSRHFIQQMIDADLAEGKNDGKVHTRFPPEPNGYLHIGHAKAICISFGLAEEYGGLTNLRFDDTNPIKEDVEYVDAIREDISWLGYKTTGGEYFTSDYFEQLYNFALKLIDDGKAHINFFIFNYCECIYVLVSRRNFCRIRVREIYSKK